MIDTTAVETYLKNPNDPDAFANWLGVAPATDEDDDAAPVSADAAEAPEANDAEEAPEAEGEAPDADAADTPEAEAPEAEAKADPITLPFQATANDDAVDPALLAAMTVTFKADGKEVQMPLADVVRRAQSEPAAQRQVRMVAQQRDEVEQKYQEVAAERDDVRAHALAILRDPDLYLALRQQVEEYDSPAARAERAERTLAEERDRQAKEAEQQKVQAKIQAFAADVVAPTLESILSANPLVSEQEILGQFYADTAAITRNGVIPPQYHEELAAYLKRDLAAFAAERQQTYAARERRADAEARKTQVERQKLKNQTAGAAKPTALTGAPSINTPERQVKPKTLKQAQAGALSVLLGQ